MSRSQKVYPVFIVMRIPDSLLESGYENVRALLINENIAISVKSGELEICRVQATEQCGVYDHLFSNYPTIYSGKDEEFVFHDILQMTVAEFFGKYPCYGESVKAAALYHEERIEV